MRFTRHVASLTITLATLWWLLSGHTEPLLLCLGLASVLVTLVLALRLDIIDHESQPVEFGHRLIPYWLWLIREIVRSNLEVTRHILKPAIDISPTVVAVESRCRTDIGRTILANSITLTPGTVTLEVETDRIQVHALTLKIASALQTGEMASRVPNQHQPR